MKGLLLYGYAKGVTSSRCLERATQEDVAFRYLAANQHPDHDTIASFRRQHLDALQNLFVQALRLCQKAGPVKLGNVSVDGTKIMANASRDRSVPYEKLAERERYWKETVERLLAEAQQTDRREDDLFGEGKTTEDLPSELAEAKRRLKRIRKAKEELEKEAQQMLEQAEGHPLGNDDRHRGAGRPRIWRGTDRSGKCLVKRPQTVCRQR